MKRQIIITILTIASFLASLPDSAKAALLTYEGFDYPVGSSLAGQTGGTGWGLAWSVDNLRGTNTATGMTYGGLLTNGQSVVVGGAISGAGTPIFSRKLPDTLGNMAATNSDTLWLSLLFRGIGAQATGTGTSRFGFYEKMQVNATNSSITATAGNGVGVDRLSVGTPGTTTAAGSADEISLFAPSSTPTSLVSSGIATPRDAAAPAFLLMKITVDNNGSGVTTDTVQLWVNPVLENGEGGLGTAATLNTADLSLVDGFRMQNGATYEVDEVRLGTSFVSVTPVTVISPTSPTIQAGLSSGNVILSWLEASGAGYSLQGATNLASPVAWSDVAATLTTNAGTVSTVLPATNSQTFFRLKK